MIAGIGKGPQKRVAPRPVATGRAGPDALEIACTVEFGERLIPGRVLGHGLAEGGHLGVSRRRKHRDDEPQQGHHKEAETICR